MLSAEILEENKITTQLDFEKLEREIGDPDVKTSASQVLLPPTTIEKRAKDSMLDVVVCTKDRPHNLLKCISMIRNLIPYGKIFVFEGSLKPNWKVLNYLKDRFGIQIVKHRFPKNVPMLNRMKGVWSTRNKKANWRVGGNANIQP